MIDELGLTVSRVIPAEYLSGLASGALTAHGGVVRDAGGQIVAHLVAPAAQALDLVPGAGVANLVSGVAANAQLAALSQSVQQVLNVAIAGTVLSGLGLATSIVGFTYLSSRLKKVDQKLDSLAKQAKEIKQILQSSQRARLNSAIDDYRLSSQTDDQETRRGLLLKAQSSFGELTHHYKSQIAELSKPEEIEASEGYFVIACLGGVICTSDLGMGEAARDRLSGHYEDWRKLARLQCRSLLELDEPARLLDSRYVDALPAESLIRILDFTNDTERGVCWIDDLRKGMSKTTLFKSAVRSVDKPVINFAKSLPVRCDVLQSYVAHFGFLADRKISATKFSGVLEALRAKDGVELLWASHGAPSQEAR